MYDESADDAVGNLVATRYCDARLFAMRGMHDSIDLAAEQEAHLSATYGFMIERLQGELPAADRLGNDADRLASAQQFVELVRTEEAVLSCRWRH